MPTGIRFDIGFSFFGMMLLAATALFAQEASKKAAVPDDNAQAEAVALIREVYKDEYALATTGEKKVELAKKLIEKAGDTKDDLTNQFVLLWAAKILAAQAGDIDTAFLAVDEMAEGFLVDTLEMKVDVLTKVASVTNKNDEQEQIVEAALCLINQAVARDKYEAADRLGRLALLAAQKAGDATLIKRTKTNIKEIDQASKAFREIETARKTLKEKPLDPQANLAVGKYLCFLKANWKRGVPMLALGSDAALKALALKDMERATVAVEQAKVGDAWWKLAEKEEGATQKNLQCRAGYWYQMAVPQLSGFMKDKVEKRIGRLLPAVASSDPTKGPEKVGLTIAASSGNPGHGLPAQLPVPTKAPSSAHPAHRNGSRDSDIYETRQWSVMIPCYSTATRYRSEMTPSTPGNIARFYSVPYTAVVHSAELGQIKGTFVDYTGTTVTLRYEDGQLPANKSVNYQKGKEYKFHYTAFSDKDKELLKWIKDTSRKKNCDGLYELNALSSVGTEGVLTGEIKRVKVRDDWTALMHQVYHTPSGTISWDFTLRLSTKSLSNTFSGLYKITKKDVVEQSSE